MKDQPYRVPLVFIVAILITLVAACSSGDSSRPTDGQMDPEMELEQDLTGPDSEENEPDVNSGQFEAVYRVTFNATWSADTHPLNFPNNPHFSPLVGAVHGEQSVFWQRGQIASSGIEQMAETGGTSTLLGEIQTVIDEGRALATVRGGGVGTSPGQIEIELAVNRDYPLVTLVSMLAPSPDWFVGVNSFSLLDQNGEFSTELSVNLRLYDSGTDSGTRFDSGNADTQPPSPIDLVTSIPTDTDFLNGEPVVGSFVFEKIE